MNPNKTTKSPPQAKTAWQPHSASQIKVTPLQASSAKPASSGKPSGANTSSRPKPSRFGE